MIISDREVNKIKNNYKYRIRLFIFHKINTSLIKLLRNKKPVPVYALKNKTH